MATRVLSGILVTRNYASGHAVINFSDHTVSGVLGEDLHRHKQNVGGRGVFDRTPCKIVAIREIKIHETESPPSEPKHEIDYLRINDSEINSNRLQIDWACTGNSRIEEISYMVIGEAE